MEPNMDGVSGRLVGLGPPPYIVETLRSVGHLGAEGLYLTVGGIKCVLLFQCAATELCVAPRGSTLNPVCSALTVFHLMMLHEVTQTDTCSLHSVFTDLVL